MPSSARKHKPLRPPGQRVAKRNARKKRLIKYSFAPRPKAHPRRGNPRSSLYRTPPRPSGSHRRPAGTISRRPPSARRATAPERVQVPFSLDRARPVSLLARQKRNGGCIPAGQAPCGSRIPPPGRRSAAPPHPMPGAFAQPSPWLNPCVQWDAPPGGIYGQTS